MFIQCICFCDFSNYFSLLPLTYIFTSSNDMLSVGCRRFYEKAVLFSADVTVESYDGMFHDFILYPLPRSKQLLKKAAVLINE